MYIDYFCLGKVRCELFKTVKEIGITKLGDALNYWEPIYGEATIKCIHHDLEEGKFTHFESAKSRSLSYPLKGEFFAGKHNKGFYETIALFGLEGEIIVLDENYQSLLPRLIRPPKTASEIIELLTCDPRFLRKIEAETMVRIMQYDQDFLKHIKTIVLSSMEHILNSEIDLFDTKKENRLKKSYSKEVQADFKNLLHDIKSFESNFQF